MLSVTKIFRYTFSDALHVYIKIAWKTFSLGPDEDRSNLLKACLSQQKTILLVRKTFDSYIETG